MNSQQQPVSNNLPAATTPLFGRAAEAEQALDRLAEAATRLITICGPGGCGKTRLALALAHTLLQSTPTQYPDGIFLLSLAGLRAHEALADRLATLIADALGMDITGPAAPATLVLRALAGRRLLLILDNCEHVLGIAGFVSALLQATPQVQVLATSRERLNLRGETLIELEGLPYPPGSTPTEPAALAGYAAVQLFSQAARALAPDFSLNTENASAIAQICQLVAGLPLGLELAASWVPVLSCSEIAAEIAANLAFLAADTHDLPARQQSLWAVFASSWELLTPPEQQALRRLALFRSGFTREAAAAVAGAGLPLLAALVKKSLVRRLADAPGASGRYTLLEPLRQYAAEQLDTAGESSIIASQHASYYLGWLASQAVALRGAGQREVLRAISAEIAEVRSAWANAIANRNLAALGAAADALFHFYTMRSWFQEGAESFAAACAIQPPNDPLNHGRLLARTGWFAFLLGQHAEARRQLEASLALLRPLAQPHELIFPLNYLASVERHAGAYELALHLAHEGLSISEACGDTYGIVITKTTISQTAYQMRRYAEARSYAAATLPLEAALGNQWGITFTLITLGQVAAALGEHAEAHRRLSEALAIREALDDPRGMALCLNQLGATAVARGQPAAAADYYCRALLLFRAIGNQWGSSATLTNLGRLAISQQQDGAATVLLQAALQLALGLAAIPHITAVLAAYPPLLRRAGATSLAVALEGLASQADGGGVDQQQIEQVLAWQPGAGSLPTLEAAIAAVQAPAHTAAPVPPDATQSAGLTTREVQVLRLLAEGLTDAQIAERLVLSPRTVSTYLSSIYGKLGLNSRSAATRWALEHGLG